MYTLQDFNQHLEKPALFFRGNRAVRDHGLPHVPHAVLPQRAAQEAVSDLAQQSSAARQGRDAGLEHCARDLPRDVVQGEENKEMNACFFAWWKKARPAMCSFSTSAI